MRRQPLLPIVALLGVSSGLPLLMVGSTLQAWYSVSDISLAHIGWLSMVGLPYLLKFLWAPLLDALPVSFFGLDSRRSWVLLMQFGLAVGLVAMAFMGPAHAPISTALLAGAVAACAATQDTALDAWRLQVVPDVKRGLASAWHSTGYRLAMILAGGGALIFADLHGWRLTYLLMAGLLVLMGWVTHLAPAGQAIEPTATGCLDWFKAPLADLRAKPKFVWVVAFIVLYKMPDAVVMVFGHVFLLRGLQLSLTEVGTLFKVVGLFATIVGAMLGGWWLQRLNMRRALLGFAVLQALGILGYWMLAIWQLTAYHTVAAVVFVDSFAQGLLTTALMAWLMGLTTPRFAASQFALFTALAAVGRVAVGPIAGWIAASWGWQTLFISAALSILPALLCLQKVGKDYC